MEKKITIVDYGLGNIHSLDLKGLARFCEDISQNLKVGDIICLIGELGSGKTTCARNIINSIYEKNKLEFFDAMILKTSFYICR